jgi:hypothetical protein
MVTVRVTPKLRTVKISAKTASKRLRYVNEEYSPEFIASVYEALADPRRYTYAQVKQAIRARERGEPFPFD